MAYLLTDEQRDMLTHGLTRVATSSAEHCHGRGHITRAKSTAVELLLGAAAKMLDAKHAKLAIIVRHIARAYANAESVPIAHADAEHAAEAWEDAAAAMNSVIDEASEALAEYECAQYGAQAVA